MKWSSPKAIKLASLNEGLTANTNESVCKCSFQCVYFFIYLVPPIDMLRIPEPAGEM